MVSQKYTILVLNPSTCSREHCLILQFKGYLNATNAAVISLSCVITKNIGKCIYQIRAKFYRYSHAIYDCGPFRGREITCEHNTGILSPLTLLVNIYSSCRHRATYAFIYCHISDQLANVQYLLSF